MEQVGSRDGRQGSRLAKEPADRVQGRGIAADVAAADLDVGFIVHLVAHAAQLFEEGPIGSLLDRPDYLWLELFAAPCRLIFDEWVGQCNGLLLCQGVEGDIASFHQGSHGDSQIAERFGDFGLRYLRECIDYQGAVGVDAAGVELVQQGFVGDLQCFSVFILGIVNISLVNHSTQHDAQVAIFVGCILTHADGH